MSKKAGHFRPGSLSVLDGNKTHGIVVPNMLVSLTGEKNIAGLWAGGDHMKIETGMGWGEGAVSLTSEEGCPKADEESWGFVAF